MNINLIENHNHTYTLDANYQRPNKASIHIVVEAGRAILIDSGTNNALPLLKMALNQLNIADDALDYLFLTHVHLDHAGGAGAISQAFPYAKVVVHSRGARHMIDPTKLISSSQTVYGEEKFRALYGDIIPIAEEKIIIGEDNMIINWQNREILIIDTPGHARHHLCFFDKTTKSVFSGDTLGLSYREMDIPAKETIKTKNSNGYPIYPKSQFVFVTTTPTQFDPDGFIDSLNRLIALKPQFAYLTHFGEVGNVADSACLLIRQINDLCKISLANNKKEENREELIANAMREYLIAEAKAFGSPLAEEEIIDIWQEDIILDAQGLVCWLDNQKK